jgi:predicted amidohydrolase
MKKKLNIALIQADLVWEVPKANRANFEQKIKSLPNDTDVVVLPEMFTTGFTMNAKKIAETMKGETVLWMKSMALEHDVAIVGSLVIKENKRFYNRFLFVEPSGYISIYDKRHTFTLAGEDRVYSAGKEKVIIHYKGWKIRPLICYDLRFPVWSRNTEDYDVLIYVANWPKTRIVAWDILLQARAIENMCYSVGVNRVGIDGTNSKYSGHSAVYNVLGELLTSFKPNEKQVEIVTLEKRHITAYRKKLRFLDDRDAFKIT